MPSHSLCEYMRILFPTIYRSNKTTIFKVNPWNFPKALSNCCDVERLCLWPRQLPSGSWRCGRPSHPRLRGSRRSRLRWSRLRLRCRCCRGFRRSDLLSARLCRLWRILWLPGTGNRHGKWQFDGMRAMYIWVPHGFGDAPNYINWIWLMFNILPQR